jgi:uncharacterized membrane protein
MQQDIARFASLVFTALIAGGTFVIWAGFDPVSFSPATYIEQQQNAIRGLNVLMPVLGGLAIVSTLICAWLQRKRRSVFVLLIVGVAFLILSGLITRFGNQPINDIVVTWNAANAPASWTELRDQWWGLHRLRTICALIALVVIVWSNVRLR